jgi:hypothetical protein
VGVDFDDFFNGGGFEEDGGYAFFDAEDYAFGGADTDGGGSELDVRGVYSIREYFDCFDCIFDLE